MASDCGIPTQKFYCGTYLLLVDLTREQQVRYLRVQWRMGRWGETDPKPVVGFYVPSRRAVISDCGRLRRDTDVGRVADLSAHGDDHRITSGG